jgi:hypothetical protein
MATKKPQPGKKMSRKKSFRIRGKIELTENLQIPPGVEPMAYAFDAHGQFLGSAKIDASGRFDVAASLSKPSDCQVLIGPAADPQKVRRSKAVCMKFSSAAWKKEGAGYRLPVVMAASPELLEPLIPTRVCVSGRVHKLHLEEDEIETCPIPFVKVEVYDVDREACLWPLIERRWPELADKLVFDLPELIEEPPFPPPPWPGPGPIISKAGAKMRVSDPTAVAKVSPQPEPPTCVAKLGPQPEPPDLPTQIATPRAVALPFARVGEVGLISHEMATRLDNLTLVGKVPPWGYFRHCFYSREIVCETITDENGYFRCCFDWWPSHFRRGRLRFDRRPDIIVKLTQVIDGVETVLYMDPYTSTRWDSTNAYIDLWLNNEEIQCGSGDAQERPAGAQAFFTRIGDTEVYRIDQSDGLLSYLPLSNLAFGRNLSIHAQFGENISDGSPARYYRLSYARHGSPDDDFVPITTPLIDTRVNKATNFSEQHSLGPQPVNGVPALYEVRNFDEYLWYHPDRIGTWQTRPVESDTARYTLRLEVFDENGNKLDSAVIDYLDGTQEPDGILPPMEDRCDVLLRIDNKAPNLDLQIPSVINACGVIPWSDVPPLDFDINVAQENGRLRRWRLEYTKGISPAVTVLAGIISNNGTPASVSDTITGGSLLDGLETTCAFALKLWAKAHITDGRITGDSVLPRTIYRRETIRAIAIERCHD